MGDMLSQAEIDALLGGGSTAPEPEPDTTESSPEVQNALTNEQKDILGEIGNISMGTSATTLFALLNQKVWITTPHVTVRTWRDLSSSYSRPCVGIRVDYKEGLRGSNVLILKVRDVKIIANLMMGGDGTNIDEESELSDLDLSAIGEAMNQMVGSSSTSLSSMIKSKIDIDTPQAFVLDFTNEQFFDTIGFLPDDIIVCTAFRMEIGTLIDSEIMQILPVDFAMDMVESIKTEFISPTPAPTQTESPTAVPPQVAQAPIAQPQVAPQMAPPQQQSVQQPIYDQPIYQTPPQNMQQPMQQQAYAPQPDMYMYTQQPQQPQQQPPQQNVNVQPVQFQNFDVASVMQQKENIDIIMDVPLEVTVELGRTRKKIKDILEFAPGSIVELDKLAGEPIDILVNGKFVARGEVVVIDENFAIRITDIISADKRI